MISDDEYLERIVAGIHQVASPGAAVEWNVLIGGRQFDVAATFDAGLYKILTVVEVRNKKRPITAEQLDAFVTKGADAGANKLVFVSASGFQSGAVTVASKHGVELHEVSFDPEAVAPPTHQAHVLTTIRAADRKIVKAEFVNAAKDNLPPPIMLDPELRAIIEEIEIIYVDGHRESLPSEHTQITYYSRKTTFGDGQSIADKVPDNFGPGVKGQRLNHVVKFAKALQVAPPDEFFFSSELTEGIRLTVVFDLVTPFTGPYAMDAASFAPIVVYKTLSDGIERRLPAHLLPLGERNLVVGEFYCGYHPLRYFHCDRIVGELAHLTLVESFQHGDLIQSSFTQDRKYAFAYMKVRDQKTLARLRTRLERLRALSRRKTITRI